MPDKTLFTPLQLDLSLNTYTPSSSPPRRNDTISRTSSFRLGSLLSRKTSVTASTSAAPTSPTADVAGPRFQQRDSTDGGPGTAGYDGTYKVNNVKALSMRSDMIHPM